MEPWCGASTWLLTKTQGVDVAGCRLLIDGVDFLGPIRFAAGCNARFVGSDALAAVILMVVWQVAEQTHTSSVVS